ncbi:MAG TPA: hypothetical protein VGB77_05745 [Abditibacteriaceae bacterium]
MRLLLSGFLLLLWGCTSQAQPEKRKEETKDKLVVKIEIIHPPLPPQKWQDFRGQIITKGKCNFNARD